MHQSATILRRDVTRTKHRIGALFRKGDKQRWDVCRVVFQIGIVNDADLARRMFDGIAYGRAFAQISFVAQQDDTRVARGQPLQNRPGAVRTPVVDYDHFETADEWMIQRENSSQTCFDDVLLVVDWHHDAEAEGGKRRL